MYYLRFCVVASLLAFAYGAPQQNGQENVDNAQHALPEDGAGQEVQGAEQLDGYDNQRVVESANIRNGANPVEFNEGQVLDGFQDEIQDFEAVLTCACNSNYSVGDHVIALEDLYSDGHRVTQHDVGVVACGSRHHNRILVDFEGLAENDGWTGSTHCTCGLERLPFPTGGWAECDDITLDLCCTRYGISCLNDGICVDGQCNCADGYTGETCGIELCSGISCLNDGICLDGECDCADGYIGENCETGECQPLNSDIILSTLATLYTSLNTSLVNVCGHAWYYGDTNTCVGGFDPFAPCDKTRFVCASLFDASCLMTDATNGKFISQLMAVQQAVLNGGVHPGCPEGIDFGYHCQRQDDFTFCPDNSREFDLNVGSLQYCGDTFFYDDWYTCVGKGPEDEGCDRCTHVCASNVDLSCWSYSPTYGDAQCQLRTLQQTNSYPHPKCPDSVLPPFIKDLTIVMNDEPCDGDKNHVDLNRGTTGNFLFPPAKLYFCYKRTFSWSEAMGPLDMVVYDYPFVEYYTYREIPGASWPGYPFKDYCPDGCPYDTSVNLNEGTTAKSIYLCRCFYPYWPEKVKNLWVIAGDNADIECPGGYTKVEQDLNEDAGGDFIYLCLEYHIKSSDCSNIANTEFWTDIISAGLTNLEPSLFSICEDTQRWVYNGVDTCVGKGQYDAECDSTKDVCANRADDACRVEGSDPDASLYGYCECQMRSVEYAVRSGGIHPDCPVSKPCECTYGHETTVVIVSPTTSYYVTETFYGELVRDHMDLLRASNSAAMRDGTKPHYGVLQPLMDVLMEESLYAKYICIPITTKGIMTWWPTTQILLLQNEVSSQVVADLVAAVNSFCTSAAESLNFDIISITEDSVGSEVLYVVEFAILNFDGTEMQEQVFECLKDAIHSGDLEMFRGFILCKNSCPENLELFSMLMFIPNALAAEPDFIDTFATELAIVSSTDEELILTNHHFSINIDFDLFSNEEYIPAVVRIYAPTVETETTSQDIFQRINEAISSGSLDGSTDFSVLNLLDSTAILSPGSCGYSFELATEEYFEHVGLVVVLQDSFVPNVAKVEFQTDVASYTFSRLYLHVTNDLENVPYSKSTTKPKLNDFDYDVKFKSKDQPITRYIFSVDISDFSGSSSLYIVANAEISLYDVDDDASGRDHSGSSPTQKTPKSSKTPKSPSSGNILLSTTHNSEEDESAWAGPYFFSDDGEPARYFEVPKCDV